MVARAPEITGSPAEDLRAPVLAIAQDEPERPEPGHPVIRIVQAQLGAQASDLPLRRELRQSQLDQALHLFREQHHFSSSRAADAVGEQAGCHGVPYWLRRLKIRAFERSRSGRSYRQRHDIYAAIRVTLPRLRTHWRLAHRGIEVG